MEICYILWVRFNRFQTVQSQTKWRWMKLAFYGDKIIPCCPHVTSAVVPLNEVHKPLHLSISLSIHLIIFWNSVFYRYIHTASWSSQNSLTHCEKNVCNTGASFCSASLPCEKLTGNNLEIWQNQLASVSKEQPLWPTSGIDKMKGTCYTTSPPSKDQWGAGVAQWWECSPPTN